MENVKFITKGNCKALEGAGLEGSGSVIGSYEYIGGINHENDVLFRRNLKASAIKISDAQRFHHRYIHSKAH